VRKKRRPNIQLIGVDSLRADQTTPATVRDGRISVEICLAAYQSAREGRRVTFGEQ
jgi:predicted dehydrogenase